MAAFKVTFRISKGKENEGKIYYRFVHGRIIKHFRTNYKIFVTEWNSHENRLIIPDETDLRYSYLLGVQRKIRSDLNRLNSCLLHLKLQDGGPDVEQLVVMYNRKNNIKKDFFSFMQNVIEKQFQLGNMRMGEIYSTTMNSLMRFCRTSYLPFDSIDSDFIASYEIFLKGRVAHNTSSFYMRNLRALYNRAVDKGYTKQNHPFRNVYTGVEKTIKRAVQLKVIRKIKSLKLDDRPNLAFARDIFLFSFYTRGMSFVDIAFLRKSDLANGVLTYRRRKTGQRMMIKWEGCMNEIALRYNNPDSVYMFPIVCRDNEMRVRDYRNIANKINTHLRLISGILNLERPLTMYVARHSWASVAKSKNIPISVISDGMGHDSEKTTRIYLAMLDTVAVDKANKIIINSLL